LADTLEDGSPDAEEVLRKAQTPESLERVVEKLPVSLRTAFRLCVFSEAWEALNKTLKANDLAALSFWSDGPNWKPDGN